MREPIQVRSVTRPVGAAICAVMLALSVPAAPPRAAAAAVPAVGVVDFYAISPISSLSGLFPERFAADDLSAMLARAGAGRIAELPRRDVQEAERALAWQNSDAIRFGRLSDLARRLHADRLVVGWIKQLTLDRGGGDQIPRGGGGGGGVEAHTFLQVQVFDAAQGRIVWGVQSEDFAMGLVAYLTVEEVLHRALAPTVRPTLAALTGAAP